MYCVGCGERLRADDAACARCGTRALGASFDERVRVVDEERVRTPSVCCCCLAPASLDTREERSESGLGRRRTLTVPMPWCEGCLGVRRRTGWLALASAVAGHVAVFAAVSRFVSDGAVAFAVGFVGALLAAAIVPVALRPLRPSSRWPGHVAGCGALSSRIGTREATLVFHNRAFATIWRELQAGREPTGPSLEWARPKVRDASAATAPRPPELAGARQKHMAAGAQSLAHAAAAQHAHAPARPVRGVALSTPKIGADIAAGALRFVTKECTFDASGVLARTPDGRERRVQFADITEVVLRQLPGGPPFAGTLLLDLVVGEAAPPLRLLPTTRANYAALPGRGVTSQENFRRLAEHVLAQHPAAQLETASQPFVRDGKAPPRADTLQQFLDYDARYP